MAPEHADLIAEAHYAREALAMQRWLAQMHQADLTVSQVQAKIKLLHELCELQADLIGALVEERRCPCERRQQP